MKKLLLIGALFSLAFSSIYSQCMLVPIPLNQRVTNSSHIVEGKVIDQKCFWDPLHHNIYTSNLIEVYKTFKNKSDSYIEVVTLGGRVDNRILTAEPSLNLSIGDVGVFTLNTNELLSQFGKTVYEAYADAQGFIKYNVAEDKGTEPFKVYTNLNSNFYTEIQQAIGSSYTVIKPYDAFLSSIVAKASTATAIITGFSPTTITAGTSSVLTINGSGFGTTQGTSFVEFANANKGEANYIQPYASEYVLWSDTQIKVKVPSTTASPIGCAGTGLIRVDVGGVKSTSSSVLTVSYSHLNIYDPTYYVTKSPTHISMVTGGYEFKMYNGFNSNTPAKTAFLRALDTWRCETKINFKSTTTTTTNVAAGDYINIVRFDIGYELPVGLRGRTNTWTSSCGTTSTTVKWYIDEIDITFNDTTNLNFGPAMPNSIQDDFETIALHELGHAHAISHVIDTLELMHASLSISQVKRNLTPNALAAGNAAMTNNSNAGVVCSQPKMVALTASNCALAAPIAAINSNSLACTGESISLTDASSGTITSWTWSMPGGTPATANTQNTSVSYATSGVKTISLTTTNNLGSSTTTKTITVGTCTGINTLFSENQLLIYPNPGKGLFTVQLNEDQTINAIDVINSLGQIIYTKNDIKSSIQTIDLTNVGSGVYYLKATTTKGTILTKLVKE